MAVKTDKINKGIKSCSIKASKVAELMKLDESMVGKLKGTSVADMNNKADSTAIETYDIESFWQKFLDEYNDERCEDLWNWRIYQDNDSGYDETMVFGCPDSQNLYLVLSVVDGCPLQVFYAFVDSEGNQQMMWHHSDYNKFEEELDFNLTYNCFVDSEMRLHTDNKTFWRNKYTDYDVQKILHLCKTFVNNEGVVPKCIDVCSGIFPKFMRKFGYTKKEFTSDVTGGFGEILNGEEWLVDAGEKMSRFYTTKGVGKSIERIHQEFCSLTESMLGKIKSTDTIDLDDSVDKFFNESVIKDIAIKKGFETVYSRNNAKDYLLDFGAMGLTRKDEERFVWFKSDECVTFQEDGEDYVLSTLDYLLPEDKILCLWNHCQYSTDNEYLRVTLSSDIQDYFTDLTDSQKKLVIRNVVANYCNDVKESMVQKVRKSSVSDIEQEMNKTVVESTVRELIETYGSDKNYLDKTVEFGCLPPFEQEDGMRNLKKMKAIMHPDKIKRMVFREHIPFEGSKQREQKCATNIHINRENGEIEVTYWHPQNFLDSYVFYGAYSCDTVSFFSFTYDEQQIILNNLRERCSVMKKPRKKKVLKESMVSKVKSVSFSDIDKELSLDDIIIDLVKQYGDKSIMIDSLTYSVDSAPMPLPFKTEIGKNKHKKIEWYQKDKCIFSPCGKEWGGEYVLFYIEVFLDNKKPEYNCCWTKVLKTDGELVLLKPTSQDFMYVTPLSDIDNKDKRQIVSNIKNYYSENESMVGKIRNSSEEDLNNEVDSELDLEELVKNFVIEKAKSSLNCNRADFGESWSWMCIWDCKDRIVEPNDAIIANIQGKDYILTKLDYSKYNDGREFLSGLWFRFKVLKNGNYKVLPKPASFRDKRYKTNTPYFEFRDLDRKYQMDILKKISKKENVSESMVNKIKSSSFNDLNDTADSMIHNLDGIKRLIVTEGTRDQEKGKTVYELDIKDYASVPVCFELLDDLGIDNYDTADDENGHLYEYGMAKLIIDKEKIEDCSLIFFIVDVYEMYDEIVASVNWSDLAEYNEQGRIAEELGFTEEDYPSMNESMVGKVKKSSSSDLNKNVDTEIVDIPSFIKEIAVKKGIVHNYSDGVEYILDEFIQGEPIKINGKESYDINNCVVVKEYKIVVDALIYYKDSGGEGITCMWAGYNYVKSNHQFIRLRDDESYDDTDFDDLTPKEKIILFDNIRKSIGVNESMVGRIKNSSSVSLNDVADNTIFTDYSSKLKKFIWECDDIWQDNERQYVNYDNTVIGGMMVERLLVDLPDYIEVDYGDDENVDDISYYNYNDKKYYENLDEISIKDFVLYVRWFGGSCSDFDKLKPEFQEQIFNSVKNDFKEGDMNPWETGLFKKYCLR